MASSSPTPEPRSPLWLSHHPPDQADRCVAVGGRHVCRRCLVLYPLAFAAAALTLWAAPAVRTATAVMWIAPVPATLDWALEHLGVVRPSARRLTTVTAIASLGLGVALATWVRSPFDPAVMAPMAVHLAVALVAWAMGVRRSLGVVDHAWEEQFEAAEADRRARLAALVGVAPVPDQAGTVTKSMSSSTAPTNDGSRSL